MHEFDHELAKLIDHTLLKADTTPEQIKQLCEEAIHYKFASVCINPTNVALVAKFLKHSDIKISTVIGFPLGATTSTTKAIETRDAIANGAHEIDMVIDIGALKGGDERKVLRDIQYVIDAATDNVIVKVILETALLTKDKIIAGALLAKKAGADFVKTSTGFSSSGAQEEDILLIRETIGPEMNIKAAGGIRDKKTALQMIKAGANRIGTSASVAIVTNGKNSDKSENENY